jgi:hypothetical protein
MIIVPDNFATYTESREGDAGRLWIERLPGLFEILCHQWNLVIDGPPMHGGLSLVLAVQLGSSAGNLLVNYDLIYADVLASEREPWLVVDPKVVVGDLEYGVAQLLWRRLDEMQAKGGLAGHMDALIEAAGLVPDLTRSWTVVRCVDYWLWGVSIGLTQDPTRCEAIIDWLGGIHG